MKTGYKILIGAVVVGTIAYLTRDKWMPKKKEEAKPDAGKSVDSKPTETTTAAPVINKEVQQKAQVRPVMAKSSFADTNMAIELDNK